MRVVSLSLLVLKTHQLDVVKRFYETIGIEFIEEQHGTGPVHFAGRVGNLVIEIYPSSDQGVKADATTRLGFIVEDIVSVIESLSRQDLSPLKKAKQSEWGMRAVVKDPDGRSVELYSKE